MAEQRGRLLSRTRLRVGVLRDDLGTSYQRAGMFGGAPAGAVGGTAEGGISFYAPAIPAEAAWLEVFTKGGIVRFDLAE